MRNEHADTVPKIAEIYLAGGCFWGVEGYFKRVKGVVDTEVGYANGHCESATYQGLSESGHAETLKLVYDKHALHTAEVIDRFFRIIDPYSVNKQGNDRGSQYRSGIYYTDESDLPVIEAFMEYLAEENNGQRPATEVEPLEHFINAEDYHQDYLDKNPGGYCHINLADADNVLYPAGPRPSDEELRKELSELSYDVTQKAGTELPGSSEYNDFSNPGIYVDIVTGQPLFSTEDQFNAGCGWPSFSMPITTDIIMYQSDHSLMRPRTEVKSLQGDSHLGHVFDDGPSQSGGLRYCINGAALRFIPFEKMDEAGYGRLKAYVPSAL